jgi:hypothetical protein
MAGDAAHIPCWVDPAALRGRQRDFIELAIAYGLILLVVWTPRPWQLLFLGVAAASIAALAWFSFDGRQAVGLRMGGLLRSLWVAGLAMLLAAAALTLTERLHLVRLPGAVLLLKGYWGYALWAFVQQFLLHTFFLSRLLRLVKDTGLAVTLAAILFAAAHLPNPVLTPVTLLLGLAACRIFLRYRNLYPLALAHAILGITIAIVAPKPANHNMRVGLGYLTYNAAPKTISSVQP